MNERRLYSQEPLQTAEQILTAGQPLVDHFGIEADPHSDREGFRSALAQLDPRYKGERSLVRWQLEADQTVWPEATDVLVKRTAESMRMMQTETPLQGRFDLVLVLGGARQAPADRARYAVKCLFSTADFIEVAVLGSQRPLNEQEQANVTNYALKAQTEADLAVAATTVLQQEDSRLAEERQVKPKIKHAYPRAIDQVKASTADVVAFELSKITGRGTEAEVELPQGFKLGAVTTQIYQPATQLDIVRVAKDYGITDVFTAGNPSDPNVVAKRTTATYLSEVLRTLRAASLAV